MIKIVVFFLTAISLPLGSEAIGSAILNQLGFSPSQRYPLLACAIGFVVLTALIITSGILAAHTPTFFWWLWWLWLVAAVIRLVFYFPPWVRDVRIWLDETKMLLVLARISLLVLFVVLLTSVLTPETRHDPYDYHLSVPNLYLRFSEIVEVPWHVFSYMPKNGEMLFSLALAIHNDTTAKLIHFVFGCLCVIVIIVSTSHWGNRECGLAAGVAAASLPVVGFVATAAYVDLIRAFWELMALWVLYCAYTENDTYTKKLLFIFSALFAGMALGSKYVAWLVFGVPFFVLYLAALYQAWPRKMYEVLPFSILGVLLPLTPWLILNYQWTGNPVYPLLPSIFGFNIPPAKEAYEFFRGHAPPMDVFSPYQLFKFLSMRIKKLLLDGNSLLLLGAIAYLASPWWRRLQPEQSLPKPVYWGITGFIAGSTLLFFLGTNNHDGRFFLSTLMLLSIPVTYFFFALCEWLELHSNRAVYILPGLVLILFFNALTYRFSQLQDQHESMIPILSEEQREEWLTRRFPGYPLVKWANENLSQDSFVLGMGYPLRRKNLSGIKHGYIPGLHELEPNPKAAELAKTLHEIGITHVAKPYPQLSESIDLSILEERYFSLLYEHRLDSLYRFHPSGIVKEENE